MPHINLLPWREERRDTSKKEFLTVLGGIAIIAVLLIGLMHLFIMRNISTQNSVNNYLNKQMATIKAEVDQGKQLEEKKQTLLSYVNELHDINKERIETVLLFNQLIVSVPDGVYLTHFERDGETVEINGIAESNTSVSQLMRNIERSETVRESILSRIENTDKSGQGINVFTVKLVLNTIQTGQQKTSKKRSRK